MTPLSKMLKAAIVSGLVLVLGGCQVLTAKPTSINSFSCIPIAPSLEWYEHEGGGIYYPERSVENLMVYIEQLNDCINYYQTNPG